MARKAVVEVTDDVDGSVIAPGRGQSISFGFDGASYVIDLGDRNVREFRKALDRYVDVAEKVGGRHRMPVPAGSAPLDDRGVSNRVAARTDPEQLRVVREWASANGYVVSPRGRISGAVMEAFSAAH